MISTLQHFNLSMFCLDNELYVLSSIRVFYIHLRHIRPDRKTQIVNCRQNKTHSRKQVLKYVNLVKSRSTPPWTPYQGFALDPRRALSGPMTRRREYAYTSICSSCAPDPLVHPNTTSIYGKCDVPFSNFVLNLYYLPFIVKQITFG